MGTVSTNDLKKRLRILVDDQPWMIVDSDFVKPGKGQAFTRVKIKNLLNGRVIEKTYKAGFTVETADVSYRKMDYLYNDGENWSFMDSANFEQVEVPKDMLDGADQWLLDNTPCEVAFWGEKVISVTPPTFMDLEITYTEPAVRGNTSTNVTKDATVETGATIHVPLFIDTGMKIKIDTRTGEYVERSKG
jgi:elongation factor P